MWIGVDDGWEIMGREVDLLELSCKSDGQESRGFQSLVLACA